MDPEQIDKLRRAETFPEQADRVEIIQTHLSVVCLSGNRVYKLKKSIELPFADFSTLEKRREFCEEELQLNRRLCPEIYLEVVRLVKGRDGRLGFLPGSEKESDGETIDYAVKMVRLPAERMLDVLLGEDAVSEEAVREIAARMVSFHREARNDRVIADHGAPQKLCQFALDNFAETREMVGAIFPAKLHRALARRTAGDFDRWGDLLRERARNGLVVDGHGDLHARNICLTDPVSIYDCIEFNPGLRCGDVASEHAFFVMDLRFRGHPELARIYLNAVVGEGGDRDLRRLMPMLVSYRAMVRAKVVGITAGEEEVDESTRRESLRLARRYFRLAAASALEGKASIWIALCGLPATGKSTLARALVEASGKAWKWHASDLLRKELAGVPPQSPLPASYYRPEFSRRVYDELYRRAESDLESHPVIVLDANFRSREDRGRAREAAKRCGARLVLVEVAAPEEVIRRRLRERAEDAGSTSDADWSVYEKLKGEFETPDPDEVDDLARVASGDDAGAMVDEVLAELV